MSIAPPPRQDKELTGHTWQEWFRQLWNAINNMDNYNLEAIGAGAIPGKTPTFFSGWFDNAVNNTIVDIWYNGTATPTKYVFPTTQIQMQVQSSDNIKDIPGGTGARVVEIHYLDNTWTEHTTTVTLNGTAAVTTSVSNIFRVNYFYVTSVGSDGVPAGNITLTNVGNTVTYAAIQAGLNKAPHAIYTVPANKSLMISSWDAASGTSTGTHFTKFYLRATMDVEGSYNAGVFDVIDIAGTLNGTFSSSERPVIKVPAKTDIKVSVVSDANNANAGVATHIMGWLE